MTDRKKPSAGFWITVALLAVLVGYPISWGPVCWICRSRLMPQILLPAIDTFYAPIDWFAMEGPTPVRNGLLRYAGLVDLDFDLDN